MVENALKFREVMHYSLSFIQFRNPVHVVNCALTISREFRDLVRFFILHLQIWSADFTTLLHLSRTSSRYECEY